MTRIAEDYELRTCVCERGEVVKVCACVERLKQIAGPSTSKQNQKTLINRLCAILCQLPFGSSIVFRILTLYLPIAIPIPL